MRKDEIPQIARNALAGFLDKPGSILYSSHETLKPGDVYLLGFNPGGSGGNPVERSINQLLTDTANAYLDESWENQNGVWAKGEAPLQKRIQWILKEGKLGTGQLCLLHIKLSTLFACPQIRSLYDPLL